VSPDGQQFAMALQDGGHRNRIRIVNRRGEVQREFVVKVATTINSLTWAPDADLLFAGDQTPKEHRLIAVEFDGTSSLLWSTPGARRMWAHVSPDGKHLAILSGTAESNVWLIDGS
jgi:dipeptidyl aminopeptidase/acylaminoacyl peptidase